MRVHKKGMPWDIGGSGEKVFLRATKRSAAVHRGVASLSMAVAKQGPSRVWLHLTNEVLNMRILITRHGDPTILWEVYQFVQFAGYLTR